MWRPGRAAELAVVVSSMSGADGIWQALLSDGVARE
jgi:hypothetical protein